MSVESDLLLVRVLADQSAIISVLHDYCRLVDENRVDDLVSAVYTVDGMDQRPGGVVLRGRDQIQKMLAKNLATSEGTMHQLSNIQVTVAEDKANAFSYVCASHWLRSSAHKGPARPADFVAGATYRDDLVRTPQGWRIAFRRVEFHGPAGLLHGARSVG